MLRATVICRACLIFESEVGSDICRSGINVVVTTYDLYFASSFAYCVNPTTSFVSANVVIKSFVD